MPQLLPATLSSEAQRLELDRLVKLYILDCTALGGELYRFCSSVDTEMPIDTIAVVGGSSYDIQFQTINPHTVEVGDPVNFVGGHGDSAGINGDWFVKSVADDFTFTIQTLTYFDGLTFTVENAFKLTRLNPQMVFNGDIYYPVAFTASGFEWNGQGPLPLPKIQISNVNRVLQAAVRTLNDIIGATFIRIRTFRKHLDDGSDPDSDQVYPVEVFKVNRKINQNRVYIEFELASALDQEDVQIPGRQVIKHSCLHRYRVFDATTGTFDYSKATCPYAGTAYFTDQDLPISDAGSDHCSKQLSGCKLRFGTQPLPTRAFPGVGG